jgi:hypothetical protein
MKKRDLINRIAKRAKQQGVAWAEGEPGSKHDRWYLEGQLIPVPRHTDIGEGLAESIFKDCEFALGKRWWK